MSLTSEQKARRAATRAATAARRAEERARRRAEVVRTGVGKLGRADVCALSGRDQSTLWRMVKEGRFPRPEYIGRAPVWDAAVVIQALHLRVQE